MEELTKSVLKSSVYLRKTKISTFGDKSLKRVGLLNNAGENAHQIAIHPEDNGCALSEVVSHSEKISESNLAGDARIQLFNEGGVEFRISEEEMTEPEAGSEAEQKTKSAILHQNEVLSLFWESEFRRVPCFDGTALKVATLLEDMNHYKKAKELMERYSKVDIFAPQSSGLEFLSADLQHRMHTFETNISSTALFLLKRIEKYIQEKLNALTNNATWVFQPGQKPQIVDKQELLYLSQRVKEISPLFETDPAPLEKLRNLLAMLVRVNRDRLEQRSEAKEAICAAKSRLFCHCSRAVILRAALVKPWETKYPGNLTENENKLVESKHIREAIVEIAAQVNGYGYELFSFRVSKKMSSDGTFGKTMSRLILS